MSSRYAHALVCLAFAAIGCGEGPDEGGRAGVGGEAGAAAEPIASILAAAESLYVAAAFDSAVGLWRNSLADLGGTDDEPVVLTWLGLAARHQGDYEEARRLGERALELKRARGLDAGLPRSYNALGLLAWDEGRLGDAAALYHDGLAVAQRLDDVEYSGKLSNNLALVQLDLGRFAGARANFAIARANARRIGDRRSEARVATNQAVVDLWADDPASALPKLEEAARLHREVRDPVGEIEALGQRGVALAAMGHLRRGFLALDSALLLARRHGMREEEASNLEMLADLYAEAGDSRRAMESYREAAAVYRSMGALVEVGDILRSQARLQRSMGQLEGARENLETALDRHRDAGAALEVVDDLLMLAEVSAEAGVAGAAERHIQAAHERATALGLPSTQDRVALTRARVADLSAQPAAVLTALESLARAPERMPAADGWEAEALRGRAYRALGQQDSAVAAGRRAVRAVERVRRRIGTQVLRTTYTSRMAAVYGDLVLALLEQGAVQEAFEIADAARGRALLEHLSSVRASAAASLPELSEADALLRRIDELLDRLDELHGDERFDRGSAPAGEPALLADLADARSRYERLLLRFSQRQPAAAAVMGVRPVRPADVQASLADDEALIEYLVLDERLVLFVVTRSSLHALETPIGRAQLSSRVRLARELMQDAQGDAVDLVPVLSALHERLIGPTLGDDLLHGIKRVTLIPHGPLYYLPFAALRESPEAPLLGQTYSLRTLPSAGALALKTTAGNRDPGLRAAAFAPFPDRLPATAAEVALFRELDPPGTIRSGTNATEAAVRDGLSSGRPIHVASHAVMNARHPMFSRVELAPGSSGDPGDDGRLEVHELLGLRSHSPLVFLSGCETALGGAWSTDFDQREDYATLAQAFLYSGVGTVLATLWRIDDEGAAFFARRFYHHLDRLDVAEAVAAAQEDLRHSARYSHPYYWAGYVVSGGGGRITPRQATQRSTP